MYNLLISSVFILFYEFFLSFMCTYTAHKYTTVCPRRYVYSKVPRAADDGAERGGIKWYGEWSGTKPRLLLADLKVYTTRTNGAVSIHHIHYSRFINMDVESRNYTRRDRYIGIV